MATPATLEEFSKDARHLASENYGPPAAIILPNVSGYPYTQVEPIAAVRLRDALNLQNGDTVIVQVKEGSDRE